MSYLGLRHNPQVSKQLSDGPLAAWELGGDVLGLLQDRVEVFRLDEFVGLQMLEGPKAALRAFQGSASC
jgi:hypothetical protein